MAPPTPSPDGGGDRPSGFPPAVVAQALATATANGDEHAPEPSTIHRVSTGQPVSPPEGVCVANPMLMSTAFPRADFA
jgi:hypothetical protein